MTKGKTITVIPANATCMSSLAHSPTTKKRVAAYARVSTDTDEQLSSYEAQVDHYTRHIKVNPEWIFVNVYTDEGISATSTKRREGFNLMIADALAGRIDMIITKSVSRFARNTVDTLTTVRQLKEKGVEVYFEKENIYTLDSKGELLITIMSSLAQEESRSISENVTWGQRKRMADGRVVIPYQRFLGYEKGEDGKPQIVESEAATIRMIYRLFLEGKTPSAIARHLEAEGILSPAGKEKWHSHTVESILTNEKYKGHAILQKTFTVDFLTKKTKVNEGEVPQYYVENSHPAIIEPDLFDLVQEEVRKRQDGGGKKHTCHSCFSSKIVCGECGHFYGPKVWHSNSKYRRTIWQCNHKFNGTSKCETPHFDESSLKNMFLAAFNRVINCRDEIAENCQIIQQMLTDTSALDAEAWELKQDLEVVTGHIRCLVDENACTGINQAEYQVKYDALVQRYEETRCRLQENADQQRERQARRVQIAEYLNVLQQQDFMMNEFDETLWFAVLDKIIIDTNGSVQVVFRDGTVISA